MAWFHGLPCHIGHHYWTLITHTTAWHAVGPACNDWANPLLFSTKHVLVMCRFAEIRNTEQGKLEERLPWFSLTLPPWMSQTHPRAVANLRLNSHRLTTPFDIHATLSSILHFDSDGVADLSHRSLSLFKEVRSSFIKL